MTTKSRSKKSAAKTASKNWRKSVDWAAAGRKAYRTKVRNLRAKGRSKSASTARGKAVAVAVKRGAARRAAAKTATAKTVKTVVHATRESLNAALAAAPVTT